MTAMSAVEQRARAARCRPERWESWYRGIYKDATFRICAHVPQNTCGTANVSSEELNPGVLNVLNALPLPRRLDALANATRHGARRSPRKLRLCKRSGKNHGDGEASV